MKAAQLVETDVDGEDPVGRVQDIDHANEGRRRLRARFERQAIRQAAVEPQGVQNAEAIVTEGVIGNRRRQLMGPQFDPIPTEIEQLTDGHDVVVRRDIAGLAPRNDPLLVTTGMLPAGIDPGLRDSQDGLSRVGRLGEVANQQTNECLMLVIAEAVQRVALRGDGAANDALGRIVFRRLVSSSSSSGRRTRCTTSCTESAASTNGTATGR